MRVAVVDPGDFSPQYDLALTRALVDQTEETVWIGRHGFEETMHPHWRRNHFYRVTTLPLLRRLPAPLRKLLKGMSHGFDLIALERWLRAEQFDVMHFQWLPLPLIDRRLLLRMAERRAFVVTLHDSLPYNGAVGGMMTRGLFELLARADRVIVHTNQAARRLQERGVAAERIVRIDHGLLHAPSQPSGRRRQPGEPLRLLQFGKIRPYKGVDVLIDALALLSPEERASLRVRIVGEPYFDIDPLRRRIIEQGMQECVTLETGYVPEEAIAGLFDWADAALFPYREIDASGVVMAAIAQGLPVIASRVGGFAELFAEGSGEGAELFTSGDPDALAELLRRIAGQPAWRERQTEGMLARRRAIPGWPAIARSTVQVYGEAQALFAERTGQPAPALGKAA